LLPLLASSANSSSRDRSANAGAVGALSNEQKKKGDRAMMNLRSTLALVLISGVAGIALPQEKPRSEARLEREVRHELVTLPYYGVFDNLAFKIDGYKVTLLGQVTRPTLKNDAEEAIKRVEGVESVDNQIEVLPLSPNDDRIRIAIYRAVYRQASLSRYALQAVPPIHIVVKNGGVRLEGVVATEGDKNLAGVRAKGVSGVFSVTNNLRVESQGA
jgi:hyperosmotically inducible periplasmic protein